MGIIKTFFDKTFGIYKNLPKSIYAISIATVVNGMGIFVYPFLTLFMTHYLNYSTEKTGNFLMIASIVYIPGAFIGGKLADSFGRKKVMLISQTLLSISFAMCGFIGISEWIPYLVLLGLMFDGFADPARSALNTDVTVPQNRQAAFSLNYLAHNLGYSVGPILAGFLFYRAPQWLFFGNAIMGFLSILIVMIFVPESKPTKEQLEESKKSNSTEKAEEGGLFKALFTRPKLLILAVLISVCGFGYAQTMFALPLTTEFVFGTRGAEIFGFIMSINAVVVVALNAPLVKALRKNHPLINVCISCLFFAASYFLYSWANTEWVFYFLTIGWTIGEIIEATNTHYYIANNTPMSHRGRFNSIMPIIQGTGRAISPGIAGGLLVTMSLSNLWQITALFPLIAGIGVFLLFLSEKKPIKVR